MATVSGTDGSGRCQLHDPEAVVGRLVVIEPEAQRTVEVSDAGNVYCQAAAAIMRTSSFGCSRTPYCTLAPDQRTIWPT